MKPTFDGFHENTPWAAAHLAFQNDQRLTQHDTERLLRECHLMPIAGAEDHLDFCRQFFVLANLFPKSHFSPLFEKFARTSYPKSFQLPAVYHLLISDLLKRHTEPVEIGTLVAETEGKLPEWNMANPQMLSELGALTIYLGLLNSDGALLRTGLQIAHFQTATLDGRGEPYWGLWQKEGGFHKENLLFWHTHLFAMASQISTFPKFHLLMEAFHARCELARLPPYYSILSDLLLNLPLRTVVDESTPEKKEILYTYQCEKLRAVVTLTGVGTGVGGVSKGQIKIETMGPSFEPIGNEEAFGIYRPAILWEPSMARTTASEMRFSFEGWVPLREKYKKGPAHLWMRFKVQGIGPRLFMDVDFTEGQDVHFLFFVACQQVVVNDNFSLKPATLDRYVGPVSDVLLIDGEHQLKICPLSEKGKLQVIPLAGGNHFWGSHFLIAYTPDEEDKGLRFSLV